MTAFVLPNLDQSTIDELRKRIPDMSEIDVPRLEKVGKDVGRTVGKSADQALDRLLGRSRMPAWPWVAASVAVVALVGAAVAWFTMLRRPNNVDTIVDDEAGGWPDPVVDAVAPAGGASTGFATGAAAAGTAATGAAGSEFASDLSTDRTIDHETNGAIGTFGDRTADEYPAAER